MRFGPRKVLEKSLVLTHQNLWEPCLWLTVNVVCGPQDEGFPTVLMTAATGSKLAKLGLNKVEHRNTFFQYFFHFYPNSGIH